MRGRREPLGGDRRQPPFNWFLDETSMADDESDEFSLGPAFASVQPRDRGVVRAVCDLVVSRFDVPPQDVHLDSRLVEDLGMDPLDLTDLILALEEAFEIDISIAEARRVTTVKHAIECVLSK